MSNIGLSSACLALTLRHDLNSRRGLVSDLRICCTNTECNKEEKVSDPYSPEAKALNLRSALSMRIRERESWPGVLRCDGHASTSHSPCIL